MKELTCPGCQQPMDIDGIPPFTLCQCSDCSAELIIPYELDFLLLERQIGQQALFDIYEGYDLESNTPSIIYLLDNTIEHFDYFKNIAQEQATRLSNLKSKYISPVLNFGEVEGYFFVTEPKIDGFSLGTYTPDKDGFLDINQLTDVFHSMACALAVSHRNGLIHHGITADCVQIDNRKQIRLKNFFISSFSYSYDQAHKDWHHFTPSPLYISPEKAESFIEADSGDIFSLGVLFYYLLTGLFPYEGESVAEIIFSRTQNKPTDPEVEEIAYYSPEHPNALRTEIPQDISFIINKMLAYSPDERPQPQQIIDAINYHKSRKEMVKVELAQQTMTHTTTRAIPIMRNLGNLETGKVKNRKKLKKQSKQEMRETLKNMSRQVFDKQ